MFTGIYLLDISIGLVLTVGGFYLARSELNNHKFDGKVAKWTEWGAGSINYFLSAVIAIFFGVIAIIFSVFELF